MRSSTSPCAVQAVARLAQFTSEDAPGAGALPGAGRAADLFADSDPGDDEAGLAGEPDVAVVSYARRMAEPATPSQAEGGDAAGEGGEESCAAGGAAGAGPQLGAAGVAGGQAAASGFAEVGRVACAPHRLLAAQAAGARVLLGLIDDVDCAVVEARLGAPPAAGVPPAADAAPAVAEHVASVPALAYVAAGAPPDPVTDLHARQRCEWRPPAGARRSGAPQEACDRG
jgi:hypothetical protein